MNLHILKYPDSRLHQCAQPIEEVNQEIKELISCMLKAMYASAGIGLAAPQLGVLKRVIVADVGESSQGAIVLINPVIHATEGCVRSEEGCLSVPGLRAMVERAERIEIAGLNQEGCPVSFRAEGLLSICLQHEVDHLDGALFLDRVSPLQRARLLKKYKVFRGEQRRVQAIQQTSADRI